MKSTLLFVLGLALTACGQAKAPAGSVSNSSDAASDALCEAAQTAISTDPAQAHWNGIGATNYFSECAILVMFESGDKLLNFVDARIAAKKNPTRELVLNAQGQERTVLLAYRIAGVISTLPALPGQIDEPVEPTYPATESDLETLRKPFEARYMQYGMNMTGRTLFWNEPAFMAGFLTAQDLRNYVAAALAAGDNPVALTGNVDGRKVYAPILLEVIGQIVAW